MSVSIQVVVDRVVGTAKRVDDNGTDLEGVNNHGNVLTVSRNEQKG